MRGGLRAVPRPCHAPSAAAMAPIERRGSIERESERQCRRRAAAARHTEEREGERQPLWSARVHAAQAQSIHYMHMHTNITTCTPCNMYNMTPCACRHVHRTARCVHAHNVHVHTVCRCRHTGLRACTCPRRVRIRVRVRVTLTWMQMHVRASSDRI